MTIDEEADANVTGAALIYRAKECGVTTERAFIRCRWRGSTSDIVSRLDAVVTALEAPAVKQVIGPRWFRTAGSRSRALRSPLSMHDLRSPASWGRRRRLPHQPYLSVGLWNGKDGLEGMNLNISVHLFDGEPDMAVFAPFRLSVDSDHEQWRSLHEAARVLADILHGAAELTSHQLIDRAQAAGCREPVSVGYAHYFGPSSPMLPCFAQLQASGIATPKAFIIAEPGAELGPVEMERLDELGRCTGLW